MFDILILFITITKFFRQTIKKVFLPKKHIQNANQKYSKQKQALCTKQRTIKFEFYKQFGFKFWGQNFRSKN